MARRWTSDRVVFTLNNYTDQDQLDLKGNPKITYLVYGYEVGENGTPHLQGYIEVNRRCEIAWYKKHIHKTAHFEPRRGTLKEAVDYCKKDGNFHEQGEAKPDKKQGQRSDLVLIKKIIMEDHGTMHDVITQCTSYQALRGAQIMLTYRPLKVRDGPRYVHWYSGGTGLGKTRDAFEESRRDNCDIWMSHENLKWFDGYNGQKRVVIDDFRPRMITFEFFLRILDRYPVRVPIKGGFVEWEADEIYITCNKSPEELYTWEGNLREDIGQLVRRITHFRAYKDDGTKEDKIIN